MGDLGGRVALVTGGSRGIGAGIARRLARDGALVAVNYVQDRLAAERTAREISSGGGVAALFRGSVADYSENVALVENVTAQLGPISILVNNAGVAQTRKPLVATTHDEVESLLRVHAIGPHILCRLVLPAMRDLERGDIVMISSQSARLLRANSSPYNMAKAAMEALAFTLAKEEREHGIRVNVIAPGKTESDMLTASLNPSLGQDILPFGRLGHPDDIANAVAFLVSDEGAYITGARIEVDGGG